MDTPAIDFAQLHREKLGRRKKQSEERKASKAAERKVRKARRAKQKLNIAVEAPEVNTHETVGIVQGDVIRYDPPRDLSVIMNDLFALTGDAIYAMTQRQLARKLNARQTTELMEKYPPRVFATPASLIREACQEKALCYPSWAFKNALLCEWSYNSAASSMAYSPDIILAAINNTDVQYPGQAYGLVGKANSSYKHCRDIQSNHLTRRPYWGCKGCGLCAGETRSKRIRNKQNRAELREFCRTTSATAAVTEQ